MRTINQILLAVALMVFFVTGAKAEKRFALVIGNSVYRNISPLSNPRNDAELMAEVLREVGFEVVTVIDADRRGMGHAVLRFGKTLRLAGKDAVGLFYFAGHGVQARGRNYLIPVGAIIEDHADLDIEALSTADILSQLESAGNALNLVILDACRNNPFGGKFRAIARGLARIAAASGTLISFAAGPGQVAADGKGKNSPYTKALVEAIRKPGLPVEQVFKQVRIRVEHETGGKQTPWEESSLRGDFYFVEPTPEPERPSVGELETLVWNSIKDTGNAKLYEQFLQQYPQGIFSALAGIRLKELRAEDEQKANEERKTAELALQRAEELKRLEQLREAAERQERENRKAMELAYWDTVKSSGDPKTLQTYLDRYPDGAFANLAQTMIEQAIGQRKHGKLQSSNEDQVAAVDPVEPVSPDPTENADPDLSRKLQTALTNAGCDPGKIDGEWGRRSKAALERFVHHAGIPLPEEPVSVKTLELLRTREGRVCPLVCGARQVESNGKCLAKTCPAGTFLDGSGLCKPTQKSKKAKPKSVVSKPRTRQRCHYVDAANGDCDYSNINDTGQQ